VKIGTPGVRQERAEHDLQVDERGREDGQPLQRRFERSSGAARARRGQHGERSQQGEERRRQAAVDDCQSIVQEDDTEPAQRPLDQDHRDRHEPELP
jgi:hypothetical protein